MQHKEIKSKDSSATVGVAMSGGVDSSVTAKLLKNKGYQVQGFFMALAQPDLDQQIDRVKKVAKHLDVSLTVIDLADEFKETVLDISPKAISREKPPTPALSVIPG
jgi:tRNA-specific 2-thiouridylase